MPTLMGNYKVPHLDAKGEANQLFTDIGVPTTFLLTAFYWDNFDLRPPCRLPHPFRAGSEEESGRDVGDHGADG